MSVPARARAGRRERILTRGPARLSAAEPLDPRRRQRAELRAEALLRSCVAPRDWAMYRDLGFVRVVAGDRDGEGRAPYAYLIYPHKPVVAYVHGTGEVLAEYCVTFHDRGNGERRRLPDADDVLAKWLVLTSDERRLVAASNLGRPGRQIDPGRLRGDLARLRDWQSMI